MRGEGGRRLTSDEYAGRRYVAAMLPWVSVALAARAHPALDALIATSLRHGTTSLVVGQDGVPLVDVHRGPDAPVRLMSVTKSIAGLAVAKLHGDGRLADIDAHPHVAPVGTWAYTNTAVNLVSAVVGRVAGEPMDTFVDREIFRPLGIPDSRWDRDERGLPYAAAGLWMRGGDLARMGERMLGDGQREGVRVLAPGEVGWLTGTRPSAPTYGRLWWAVPAGRLSQSGALLDYLRAVGGDPHAVDLLAPLWDADPRLYGYAAEGYCGQYRVVVPEAKLVAVRLRRIGAVYVERDPADLPDWPMAVVRAALKDAGR